MDDRVAVEEPLEVRLSYGRAGSLRVVRSVSVTMRTPGGDAELAAGFLFTEGILRSPADIASIGPDPAESGPRAENRVLVTLRDGVGVDLGRLERHFYTTSSCGVCGKTSIEALGMAGAVRLAGASPVMELATLLRLPDELRRAQRVFDSTGGLHAAGIFDARGRLIASREDVGRHNAVDKVIGAEFLAGRTPLPGHALVLSGRASFELVQKALMAGIPAILSVGAPSSLAVETARQFGATLLGFAREGRINVYSGAQRLREAGAALAPA
jgi:FdhD protein